MWKSCNLFLKGSAPTGMRETQLSGAERNDSRSGNIRWSEKKQRSSRVKASSSL